MNGRQMLADLEQRLSKMEDDAEQRAKDLSTASAELAATKATVEQLQSKLDVLSQAKTP